MFREDRETAQMYARNLKGVHRDTPRALATALVTQTAKLELLRPFGDYVDGWSFEAGATTRVREILGLDLRTRGVRQIDGDALSALDNVADVDLRELVSNLMTHHLRIVGKMDTVSQGTPQKVHIFPVTDEKRQLAAMAGTTEMQALCGDKVGIQKGVGQDNMTLRSTELQKRLCHTCWTNQVGKIDAVSQGTTSPETPSKEVRTA